MLWQPVRWALTFSLTACLLLWASGRAEAFQVTLTDGTVYNVQIEGFSDATTFNTANSGGALTNQTTGWFGNSALAEQIARNFSGTGLSLPSGVTEIFFAYGRNSNLNQVDYWVRNVETGAVSDQRRATSSSNNNNSPALSSSQAWAFGTVSVVPEIDGPILMQALFILGAFYALFRGRRRRVPLTA